MSTWTDEQIDEPRTMRDRLVVSDQLLRRTLDLPPMPTKIRSDEPSDVLCAKCGAPMSYNAEIVFCLSCKELAFFAREIDCT